LYLFELVLEKKDVDKRAADMWSFGVVLWEVSTRQVPFGECAAMQCGLRVRGGMRLELPVGMSSQMQKLIRICMNEEAAKRPRFEMILPILEKLNR
jgi:integrin-linked kinase